MNKNIAAEHGWDRAYVENAEAPLWSQEPMPILEDVLDRARGCCLDLGCGDGRNLVALQQGGLDVVGLDISMTALRRADRLLRARGRAAPLILGDILSLPFADHTIDTVTALDVLGQVSDLAPVLAEVRRVLKEDGLLAANLFDLSDSTFGEGSPVSGNTFLYKDTLFRYFSRREVHDLFAGWQTEVTRASWTDPPHGDFRPRKHMHVNHIVFARPS
ncbi:MAG TPA: class I SAM-dependent methyltransferase [Solirubrobacteraceae bacterium]|nr:class I SAM-dependent methyltransferase [Solirubrobacteraceae bacterium]